MIFFSELEKLCKGIILQSVKDLEVKELATDTRNISTQSGVLFFAIEGINHDGHEFVTDAYDKGVRLFVVEREVQLPPDANILEVHSSLDAMQLLVANHRSSFDYPVIGITGSNGKTIVKEWLGQMLEGKYNLVKSPKSYNSQLGVPLSVWQMGSRHNLAIFEAGISQRGEMKKLEKIIKPTIGVFTNIGEAHNAGFASIEEKTREKADLFKNCLQVICPKEHELIVQSIKECLRVDVSIITWEVKKVIGTTYNLQIGDDSIAFKLKFSDTASVENCLNCATVLHVLGFENSVIQERLDLLSTVKMRLEMKQAINRSYVIDDTYNNDLYGLEVALDFLNRQNQKVKKTVILSDIYQTGLGNQELYERVDDLIRSQGINRIIGVGPEIKKAQSTFQVDSLFFDNTEELIVSGLDIQDEIVLVKGSRDFRFEKVVEQLEYKVHGTVLEINMENLTHNLNYYRAQLKPGVKIMVMVKAFAYGGGNFEIANLLQYHKVDYLGVAYTDEAVELRRNGIHIPIMIMNPSSDSFRYLKEYNLEPEIYSLEQLFDFLEFFENEEQTPAIHLKLETGMNRLGFKDDEMKRLAEQIKSNKKLIVKSIFSHLAGSEDPRHKEYSIRQGELFEKMSEVIISSLWYKPLRHLVNTAGIERYKNYHFNMVRLGIGLYGFNPIASAVNKLRTVSTLKSMVSQIKNIKEGESIGYGRMGFADHDMKIAIVPIGYADGYLRAFGNAVGRMGIQGQLVPTVGNICMDMTMLDVTGLKVNTGDEVIVFGESPTIADLAKWIHTIPYEILTNISQRVKRTYVTE